MTSDNNLANFLDHAATFLDHAATIGDIVGRALKKVTTDIPKIDEAGRVDKRVLDAYLDACINKIALNKNALTNHIQETRDAPESHQTEQLLRTDLSYHVYLRVLEGAGYEKHEDAEKVASYIAPNGTRASDDFLDGLFAQIADAVDRKGMPIDQGKKR